MNAPEASGNGRSKSQTFLLAAFFAVGTLIGWVAGTRYPISPDGALPPSAKAPGPSSLDRLLSLDDQTLETMDPLEVDLAVARSIPGGETMDVARYQRILDEWAAQIKAETDRYLYKFQQSPAEYKNSLAYFKALTMVTVVGQDLKVSYDVKSVAFDDPRDLFVHGVIDQRRGTCVSLPVLYMALGHRLGYPIKAVALPRHLFCRWEDRATGERFNIEAANAGGLCRRALHDLADAARQTCE